MQDLPEVMPLESARVNVTGMRDVAQDLPCRVPNRLAIDALARCALNEFVRLTDVVGIAAGNGRGLPMLRRDFGNALNQEQSARSQHGRREQSDSNESTLPAVGFENAANAADGTRRDGNTAQKSFQVARQFVRRRIAIGGIFLRDLRQMACRSRGTSLRNSEMEWGASVDNRRSVSMSVCPSMGRRPVKSSYRITPSE